jgi:hypothetical protein
MRLLQKYEGDSIITQTQQQKNAAFAAQQSNVTRLLRANKLTTAAVYSSCSAQHAQQLQRHFIRVLCSMNMLHDAMHHAEQWRIQNEIDIQIMLQVHYCEACDSVSDIRWYAGMHFCHGC